MNSSSWLRWNVEVAEGPPSLRHSGEGPESRKRCHQQGGWTPAFACETVEAFYALPVETERGYRFQRLILSDKIGAFVSPPLYWQREEIGGRQFLKQLPGGRRWI